ncbi:MAG: sigma-54 dependent transcriptional regulator [Calditrichia bacterium]
MKKPRILIIEDNEVWQQAYQKWLGDEYEFLVKDDPVEVEEAIEQFDPEIVILDLGLPRIQDGMATLDRIIQLGADAKVVVVTAYQEIKYAMDAQRKGAHSYFQKEPELQDALPLIIKQALTMSRLERENQKLRAKLQTKRDYDGMVVVSKQMNEILDYLDRVKNSNENILITGESGVGKEVLARYIHNTSKFKDKKFLALNCASLPAQLLESELFGYEKGAFTGALKETPGKLELVDGGTLFLDEIGDMPLEIQSKFLRVLEDKTFYRLGGQKEIKVDFRLVAATNKNLSEEVEKKEFREDLFYRLNVIPVQIPPLRERPDDIPALVNYFIDKFCEENEFPKPKFTNRLNAFLSHLHWEGNVRELSNLVKRLILTGKPTIDIPDLPPDILKQQSNFLDKAMAKQLSLEEVAKMYVRMVLDYTEGNKKEACRILNINYRTLMSKLEE